PITGSGRQRIQPIWVEDVAAHFAAAVEKPEAANRTFELGGPDVVTWDELWARLKRVLRVRRPSIHVPIGLMRVPAVALERLPNPPVTRDLLKMLEAGDNVVSSTDAVETFGLQLVGRTFPPDPRELVTDIVVVRSARYAATAPQFRSFVRELVREGLATGKIIDGRMSGFVVSRDRHAVAVPIGVGSDSDIKPIVSAVRRADANPDFRVTISGNHT